MRVRTEHSDYLIDEARKLIKRVPREADANELRNDEAWSDLIEVITLEEGQMAEFTVRLPDADLTTYRRTTAVVKIDR